MGRKTWESLPAKFKPLPNRLNVILTRETKLEDANDENGLVQIYSEFDVALESLSKNPKVNEIFVIGGSTVYELALGKYSDYCKLVFLTRINKQFEADCFMPKMDELKTFSKLFISKTYSHDDITFDYCFYGNTQILSKRPELVPSRLMAKYPKHPEM